MVNVNIELANELNKVTIKQIDNCREYTKLKEVIKHNTKKSRILQRAFLVSKSATRIVKIICS